jgi:hypothetical protein
MADGTHHAVGRLLSGGNFKQCKSEHLYPAAMLAHLSLAPNKIAGPHTVCPNSTAGCRSSCLFYGGRGQLHTIRKARLARTILFWQDPTAFMMLLRRDLNLWSERASRTGRRLFVRMNSLSDVEWELISPATFRDNPHIFFYDYTKLSWRLTSPHKPENYHLTFSRSELNEETCKALLANGHNVAVVFRSRPFPKFFWGFPVVDATVHDLRPFDAPGHVVALEALGEAKRDHSGFVIDP